MNPQLDNDIPVVQFLNEAGEYAPSPAAERFAATIEALSLEELQQFYRSMVEIREIDNQATRLQRQGQLALWPPSLGQEAAQVGSIHAARKQDHVFPSYREHAIVRERGVDIMNVIRQMRGLTHGGWDPASGDGGITNIYTLVLGSQTLHATGYAMGVKFDGKTGTGNPERDEAVMVYYGDGSSSQGDVHEAMVFAASYQAPVVFFMQNNHWAISVPVSTQSPVPIIGRAPGYGIEGIRADGNDVLASYAVAKYALDQARSGAGPKAVEAITYRMGAHTTSDDPTKYRTSEEEQSWAQRDPIQRMRNYLQSRGVSEEFFTQVETDAAEIADEIRIRTTELGELAAEAMFTSVYSEPHPLVAAEKQWLADYEASLEGSE